LLLQAFPYFQLEIIVLMIFQALAGLIRSVLFKCAVARYLIVRKFKHLQAGNSVVAYF